MVSAPVRRDNPPSFSEGIIDRTGVQTMLYLTCTMISSVDLAYFMLKIGYLWIVVHVISRYISLVIHVYANN